MMAAGGTGGHIYPAIAIADTIKELVPEADVRFAGTRTHMEWTAVPKAGYSIDPIWISGFHRRLTVQNLLFPVKLIISLLQSWMILRRFRPNVVICCGGYVAGPVGYVASLMGIPLMLQEQNSYPGVTNRLLGKKATSIFTAFEDAASYFPVDKVVLEGNPIRTDLMDGDRKAAAEALDLDPQKQTISIMGGSGGAKMINEAIEAHLAKLHNDQGLQIIWQCGKRYIDELRERIRESSYPNLRLRAFLDNMPGIYALSDLVICRAGASTISELLATGTPSILVPSPNVAGDHQRKNAISVVGKGAAEMLTDEKVAEKLPKLVERLLSDEGVLAEMAANARSLGKPQARTAIAEGIILQTHPAPEQLNFLTHSI
ncbi:MAG: undecaprenyldiphospho-muramoylpentapeptide beta-N-acetylglucosaminyltransferase [Bacteroidetes bacterium]|nr:undecaprenyldiphospho-muramoylpentapeptide beta-N-acetylglucosaminyltransferase [Bacteroidota bacterium]